MTSVTVGRAIRASRKRANLPLARVARKCNLSPTQLDGIESGRARPSVAVLDRIARALGMTLVDLVVNQQAAAPARGVPRRLGISDIARAILDLPEAVGSKIDVVQHATVLVAMSACQENQSAAARMLGMERKAFARKLSRARKPSKATAPEPSLRTTARPGPPASESTLRSSMRTRPPPSESALRSGDRTRPLQSDPSLRSGMRTRPVQSARRDLAASTRRAG